MDAYNHDLEEQCEDAVFRICCTREHYSVRAANQLEKQLSLTRKNLTAPVQKAPSPHFEVPVITEEQQEFFQKLCSSEKSQQAVNKEEKKNVLGKLKEMESILNMIERSNNSEVQKLLNE